MNHVFVGLGVQAVRETADALPRNLVREGGPLRAPYLKTISCLLQ
jgi:hypothetical protein